MFAVTGGLAAPALAAGIGGLASLTGAGTASSTAILAVLATFKAGKRNTSHKLMMIHRIVLQESFLIS